MDLAHAIALFSVIALSVGVLVYVYWPSNKERLTRLGSHFSRRGQAIGVDERDPHALRTPRNLLGELLAAIGGRYRSGLNPVNVSHPGFPLARDGASLL